MHVGLGPASAAIAMQEVPMDSYASKGHTVDQRGVSDVDSNDVVQVSGKNYDPSYGMRLPDPGGDFSAVLVC